MRPGKACAARRIRAAAFAAVALSSIARAGDGDAARAHAFENSLSPPIHVAGDPVERWTLHERMARWKVPGVSVAVIRNGRLAWARGYGVLQAGGREPVNAETLFSVGSVSKVAAAAVTLRLVDAGKLDLDRNVNDYLTRWHLPENRFTAIRAVTLRGILSHSAGLTVHGFDDFQPGAPLPNVLDTLEGRAPARNEPVRVNLTPGERFRYSGGGTQLEQLVIEEVTGLGFPQAARQHVLDPLGMTRSTYENPLPPELGNIAKAHGPNGEPRALPRGYESMPEMAASGLWTTPSDYAKLVIAIIRSCRGDDGFLSAAVARQMLTAVGRSPVGLGPFLDGQGMDRRFSHSGANDSYKAWIEGHPGTGNGVVIFTNGENGNNLYTEMRRAVAAAEGWSAALAGHVEVPRVALPESELAEKAGTYDIQSSAALSSFRNRSEAEIYRVVAKQGALYLSMDDDEMQRLVPLDASHFVMEAGPALMTVEFVRSYSGQVSGLVLREGAEYAIEALKLPERASRAP